MQASADDDQLVDRPPECSEYVLIYMLDTGYLFGFIHTKVVYMFQGIVHSSFTLEVVLYNH